MNNHYNEYMMKRIQLLFGAIVACFVIALSAKAQDYSKMNLHFIYIAHETSTPVNKLCERIRTVRDDALEVEDALIIYLSDGVLSPVSLTNLKDQSGLHRDSPESYTDIIAALQDFNSHNVVARNDRTNLLNLFDEYNFLDESGRLRFNSVIMDFYVGSSFWLLGNNEKIIAHLFTAFDAARFPKDRFSFNVYKPKGEKLNFVEGMPFGDNNIDGINSKLKIFEY
jgi:hypothetical protein